MHSPHDQPETPDFDLCPYCQSEDITGGPIDIQSGTAYQPCTCESCHGEWTDAYEANRRLDQDFNQIPLTQSVTPQTP